MDRTPAHRPPSVLPPLTSLLPSPTDPSGALLPFFSRDDTPRDTAGLWESDDTLPPAADQCDVADRGVSPAPLPTRRAPAEPPGLPRSTPPLPGSTVRLPPCGRFTVGARPPWSHGSTCVEESRPDGSAALCPGAPSVAERPPAPPSAALGGMPRNAGGGPRGGAAPCGSEWDDRSTVAPSADEGMKWPAPKRPAPPFPAPAAAPPAAAAAACAAWLAANACCARLSTSVDGPTLSLDAPELAREAGLSRECMGCPRTRHAGAPEGGSSPEGTARDPAGRLAGAGPSPGSLASSARISWALGDPSE